MVSQPDPQPELQRVLPDSADLHLQLQHHRHLTLQLAWEEYRHQHPDGYRYSYFCELYQQWRRKQDVVLRQQQKAGEKLFVDWAGATIPIHDRHSGQARPASLFVAEVGASSYTYAEAIRDYFTDHLPRLRGSSPRTIHSYRESIAMLLHYFSGQRGKAITQLDPTDVDPPSILAFLSYLEKE